MNRPFVWVALAFLAGTWGAAEGFCPGIALPLVLFIGAFALAILSRGTLALRPISTALSFFAAGALLWTARHMGPPGDPLSRYAAVHPATTCILEGRVHRTDLLLPDSTYGTFLLDVDRVIASEEVLPMQGRVAVRWSNPGGPIFADDRVRIRGRVKTRLGPVNPGVQDVEDYLRRRNVHGAVSIRGPEAVERIVPGRWWMPTYWASRLREAQARHFIAAIPDSALPFALTVWLGERSQISRDEYQTYIDSGTAHILAVSGVHMGIIFVSVSFLLRLIIHKRRVRTVITMGAVLLFALTAGARISAIRAALMIIIYLWAESFDREPDTPTALGLSAILFILANPDSLFDRGFQLSFASVASILIFTEPIGRTLGRLPWVLRTGLSATLAAQILPLPLAIHFFHVLPAVAPLANLLVIPLLMASLWVCFMTAVSVHLSTHAALLFGHALAPLVGLIHAIVNRIAATPATHWTLVSPTPLAMALYWAVAGSVLAGLSVSRHRRRWISGAAGLLVLTFLFWRPLRTEAEVVFLDVGHGDATFIRSPGGTAVLVDGGDKNAFVDMGTRVVGPFLWSNHVSRLDYVVVTHPDRDHIGGLFSIVEHFPIGQVIFGSLETDHPSEQALIARCAERGIPLRRVRQGDVMLLDGASLEVIHPPADWPRGGSVNDESLVLRLNSLGTTVLLPGDIEVTAEATLAPRDCSATVLKAPHHGSDTSNTPGFIRSVQPRYCVVSTGGYRGPEAVDEQVLKRYQAFGIEVWRTDILGGIRLRLGQGREVLEGERRKRGYVTSY